MVQDFESKVRGIKNKIYHKGLIIGRLPDKTKDWFFNFAKEEFDDDYGFALKKLVDVYQGMFPSQNSELELKIEVLVNKILEIEKKLEENPKKRIKTLSGRELGGKEDGIKDK